MSVSSVFLHKKNLVRDIVIVGIAIGSFVLLSIIYHYQFSSKQKDAGLLPQPVIENEAENPIMDTAEWKTYTTQWYGFELKYPNNWNKPALKNATPGAKWEYRYQFRKQAVKESDPYVGFDVVVYNVGKVKDLSNTEEFPTVREGVVQSPGTCDTIVGRLAENEKYPAEQISVSAGDDCYRPAYFYTLTRDNYIYTIVPISTETEGGVQSETEIVRKFPEFITVASTLNLIDIVQPKPAPKITAPKPIAVTKTDSRGRLICAKKDDHPRKSKKGKGKHLDMECCLDPDEYPNPWCYYPPGK